LGGGEPSCLLGLNVALSPSSRKPEAYVITSVGETKFNTFIEQNTKLGFVY